MNKKLEDYFDDKYLSYDSLEAENRAIEKFESVRQNSSENLRTSHKRTLAGFIIILCLTLALGVFAFLTNRQSTYDITNLYETPLNVRYYALRLNINALSAYGAMRDLALCESSDTANINSNIASAKESVEILNEYFSKLQSIVTEDEQLLADFDNLSALLLEWDTIRAKSIQYALDGDMEACRNNVRTAGNAQVTKITDSCAAISDRATLIAADSYDAVLAQSKNFDIYSVTLTVFILIASLFVIAYVKNQSKKTVDLVEALHEEQNEVLDELMIMDETLRQNLSRLEREGEIIREMQEKYANSLEASNDAIWELNLNTNEFFVSEKWEDITGIITMPVFDMDLLISHIYADDRKKFLDLFSRKFGSFNAQIRAYNKDSSFRWLNIRGKWLDGHRTTGSVSDITQKKQSEQYIEYIAYHDAITRLPNRAFFIRALEEVLQNSKETKTSGCVLFIDLDNFKLINDRHGHDFGDRLLLEVARRLQVVMRENTVIARFGGDEFLVLVDDLDHSDEVTAIIKRITDSLSAPILLGGNSFYVTASIGVSVFPDDGDDVNQLLKNSDAAMYESKNAGRNTFAFYKRDMSDKVVRKSAIGDVLRTAIENDSLYLVFQPQLRSSTDRADSCEALLRLRSEEFGFISPAEFIPIAEEIRMIVPIGYWVIRKAIEADLDLQKKGIFLDSISVNVSEIQLRELDFVDNVKSIIDEYDYDAARLHFEITESILLNNPEEKIVIFNELRNIGIKIELDDFGTGYCSLNYVRMIPLDVIKIDKCFIDEIGISGEKEDLIEIIIRLARTFNADVVAEGVETQQQVEFLRQKGDIIMQGYYYSRPVDAADLPASLARLNHEKLTKAQLAKRLTLAKSVNSSYGDQSI